MDGGRLKEELSAALQKLHYDLFFPDGDPVEKVFHEVPHLVIIDEDFKEGRGKHIAMNLKEDLVLKHIPVIFLAKDKELHWRDKNIKIDAYFQKSNTVDELVESIKDSISQNYNELDLNPLTHLPGSRSSLLRIERGIHANKFFSVCCIDLRNLAAYNRAYGDARGDKVIIKLGQIIQEVVKKDGSPEYFVGHLGGDDFIAVTLSEAAVRISEKVIRRFDEAIPNLYDAKHKKLGFLIQKDNGGVLTRYPLMSVSIVIIDNEKMEFSEITQIGRIANEFKEHAKALPGSCYIKYRHSQSVKPAQGEESKKQSPKAKSHSAEVTSSLFFDTLIRERQIKTFYQPIVDLRMKTVMGYEALTRAASGEFSENAAAMFAMARQAGRVKELDRLCVEQALKRGQGLGSDKKLFLNLNHETLIDPSFMKELFACKGLIGFRNIVIEVTEQSILRSFEKVREALLELRTQGVSVAIDDVGGGAVSLRDVAVLKPDYIKFDRSLIRQIDTNITKQQIILSMLLFANGIRAITTAEGIETKREYDTVVMLGIVLGQGYHIAKPGEAFPDVSF